MSGTSGLSPSSVLLDEIAYSQINSIANEQIAYWKLSGVTCRQACAALGMSDRGWYGVFAELRRWLIANGRSA